MVPDSLGGNDEGRAPKRQPVKKMKFVPNVKKKKDKKGGMQKKKADEPSAANNLAAFQDLMQVAQAEADWDGRFGGGLRETKMGSVAFGSRSVAGIGQAGMGVRSAWGGSGAGHVGSGGLGTIGEDAPFLGVKLEPKDEWLDDKNFKKSDEDVKEEVAQIDYNSYYPTLLPIHVDGRSRAVEGPLVKDLITGDDSQESDENAAGVLGLDGSNTGLMLFQLPGVLPIASEVQEEEKPKRKAGHAGGQNTPGKGPKRVATKPKNLPSGKFGKLLVFKSGKVKMRIGEILLDVSPGVPYAHRQDAVAVHVGDGNDNGHFMFMGLVGNKAVCTLDAPQLLSEEPVPDFRRAAEDHPQGIKMEVDYPVQAHPTQQMGNTVKAEQEELRTTEFKTPDGDSLIPGSSSYPFDGIDPDLGADEHHMDFIEGDAYNEDREDDQR